jgi:hypothetical protein
MAPLRGSCLPHFLVRLEVCESTPAEYSGSRCLCNSADPVLGEGYNRCLWASRVSCKFYRNCSVVGILYLNFNVVRANRAKTSDAIQKRTMTFDSDHPISSKW